MSGRSFLFLRLAFALISPLLCLACATSAPAPELLAQLIQEEKAGIIIGWVDRPQLRRIVIETGVPESHVVSEDAAADLQRQADRRRHPSSVDGDDDAQTSAEGSQVTYRSRSGDYVIADESGQNQRKVFSANGVLSPLYWSPDSKFLLYFKESSGFNLRHLLMLTGGVDLMVYRIRDGARGKLFVFDRVYPYYSYGWLEIPADIREHNQSQ